MTEKNFVNSLMVSIAVCISAFVFILCYNVDPITKKEFLVTSVKKNSINTAMIIYDAKITIPNTSITVSYPKLGYDGKGVTLGRSRAGSLMVYEKIGGVYVVSKLNGKSTDASVGGDPMATIEVYTINDEKTLDEVIGYIFKNQMPDSSKGHYEVINDVRYYLILNSSEGKYDAYALMNDRLVHVVLQTVYTDIGNDLFIQILSNIDYSCKNDCSVNANEIIEMGKERFGGEE